MSEQWGLRNHERHSRGDGLPMCDHCHRACLPGAECRCCLAAEVESLRAGRDVEQEMLRGAVGVIQRLTAEVEALRAQVQAVRDARHGEGEYPWHCPACAALHAVFSGSALDGGGSHE